MTVIAKEAGLSRNAIYNHPSVYQHILMCRTKEEERIQQLERKNMQNNKRNKVFTIQSPKFAVYKAKLWKSKTDFSSIASLL